MCLYVNLLFRKKNRTFVNKEGGEKINNEKILDRSNENIEYFANSMKSKQFKLMFTTS